MAESVKNDKWFSWVGLEPFLTPLIAVDRADYTETTRADVISIEKMTRYSPGFFLTLTVGSIVHFNLSPLPLSFWYV